MKRTITQTVTKTIEVCDLCSNDCSNGFCNHCYICQRQTCLRCSRLIDFAIDNEIDRSRRILELPLKICCDCEEVQKELAIADRLQGVMVGANHKVTDLIKQWKALVPKKNKQINQHNTVKIVLTPGSTESMLSMPT